ncbi:MAG: hypothetical protein MRJ92_07960 [Nitrospira sp.]|nr:hypothetical protein [Nitrospira sp.]
MVPDPAFTVQARWHRSVLGSMFNHVARAAWVSLNLPIPMGSKLAAMSFGQDLFSVACVDGYAF